MNEGQKTATTLPVFAGRVNLAPLEPLQRLGRGNGAQQKKHYLCDALKERYTHFTGLDRSVRNEMLNVGLTIENFMQGKQFAIPDYLNGGWRTITVPGRDDGGSQRPRAINLVSFYRTVFSSRWMGSNPDVVADEADDSDEAIAAAKAARAQIDHYEQKFFTPWFNWAEGSAALSWGTYITRLRHDTGVQGVQTLRRVYGAQTVVTPGEGDCSDCGYRGEDVEFQHPDADPLDPQGRQCPSCGSPNVLLTPPQEMQIQSLQGVEPVNLGELVLDQLPFAACWWDLAHRPEDSSFFIYNQRVSRGQLTMLMPGARLPEARGEDRGLQIMEAMFRSGQPLSGYSRFGRTGQSAGIWAEQATLNEMWLSPADYADIEIKGDEQTLTEGVTLPPGAKLTEVFPDGLVAVGINDMAAIIGLYAEQHGPSLASGVYDIRSYSGAGRGAADVVDTQQRISRLTAQFERSADAPSFLYVSDLISPENAREMTKPNKAVPADLSAFPEMKRLSDAVMPLQPTAFAPQFMEYAFTHLQNVMQLQFRTVDFAAGLPGVDNKTATGAQIAASLASGLFKPMAMIKAMVRQRNAQQILEYCQRCFPVERQYSYSGRNGKTQSITLGQIDLQRIKLKVVENSEMPVNDTIRRMQANEFLGLFGGVQGYLEAKVANPSAVAALERIYDFRLEGNETIDEAAKVVSLRIRQLQQLVMQLGDPMVAVQELQPPVQQGEPQHVIKAERCSEWLDTDEGLESPLPVRFAVEMMGRLHLQMEAEKQMFMGGIAGAIQQAAQPEQEQAGAPAKKAQPQKKAA